MQLDRVWVLRGDAGATNERRRAGTALFAWRGQPRRIHKSEQYTTKEVNCSCGHLVWLETGKSMDGDAYSILE
jgi:hypothetical protein